MGLTDEQQLTYKDLVKQLTRGAKKEGVRAFGEDGAKELLDRLHEFAQTKTQEEWALFAKNFRKVR